jgi:DNA-binding NarL/FixJ family response regulator
MAKTSRKQLLIVDDHPMMRTGLTQLIDNTPDLKVCAEADNAAQALQAVTNRNFDLILLDISLPDKSGLELIKDIQALKPGLPVLVVSMHDELLYAERVLRAGARGYIMKQEGGKKFLQAIRQVLAGQVYVSEKMSARILENFSGRHAALAVAPVQRLSDRVPVDRARQGHARHRRTFAFERKNRRGASREPQEKAGIENRPRPRALRHPLDGSGTPGLTGLAVFFTFSV